MKRKSLTWLDFAETNNDAVHPTSDATAIKF
jgi:hypothetical protein